MFEIRYNWNDPLKPLFYRGASHVLHEWFPTPFQQWDVNGMGRIDARIVKSLLFNTEPQIGDTIRFHDWTFLIVDEDFPSRSYKIMLETDDAHHYLMWLLQQQTERANAWFSIYLAALQNNIPESDLYF